MTSKKKKEIRPQDRASELFREGLLRDAIRKILQKEFPERSENSHNIAMTRAAKEYESELIRKGFKK